MAIKSLISKAWQHSSTIIFLFGFITDAYLLPEIENPITKYLGLTYLATLSIIILLREWVVARNTASKLEQRLYSLLTFGVAFFSGSALSFIFIYALRSAAFAVSWPLFVILILVMVANEFIATHSYRFTLDIGVLFVALTFYFIFDVPIIFGKVNNSIFLISIAISALTAFLYVSLLKRMSEVAEVETARGYALAIGVPLFIGMLYFLNVIPAVPLSLKSSGIYHHIERLENGEYIGQKEPDIGFLAKYKRDTYHLTDSDDGIYFFSSVGAPADISAPITHVWEYYDERKGAWITSTTVAFTMTGGRGLGYRAYSKKEHVAPGMWRVTVKVDDNRIIGRQRFYIEEGKGAEVEETKL
jgi:uncharacterized membrane protein YgdD (TMEM256/DUF423 family)